MIRIASLFSFLFLVATACSGSASGGDAAVGANTTGSVYVVVDTATGSDALVQFQVVAAVLEASGGGSTGNVLAAPQMLTLADPSGEASGFVLRAVPSGDYARLHLVFAPGSGVALRGDGAVLPVSGTVELDVPFTEDLQHSAQGRSWIEIGHNGAAPPAANAPQVWTPVLSGRPSGSARTLAGLRIAAVQSPTVTTQWTAGDDAPLQLEFEAGCSFEDEQGHGGGRDDFLRGLGRGDDVSVEGDLHHDGRCVARHVRRHGRGNDGPRLLGRITELRPAAQAFVMAVHAEVRRGDRRLLSTPVTVLVLADAARIHRSHTAGSLTFAELEVGQLAKVEWTTRTPVAGGLEEVRAQQIEVTSGAGVSMRPEWEGSVQSVDLTLRQIVVVPRHDDRIVVNGQSVQQVVVHVSPGMAIERRQPHGSGRAMIGLSDIVPGQDRIWWRGTVVGPASIDATFVRVRQDD